jgi:hypothetical protein
MAPPVRLFRDSDARLNLIPLLALAGAATMIGTYIYSVGWLHQKNDPESFMTGYSWLIGAAGLGTGGQHFLSLFNARDRGPQAPPEPPPS